MKKIVPLVLLLSTLGLSGCLWGPTPEEKLRQELLSLTKEQAFEKGKTLISERKWEKGRKYLSFVHENYPSDPVSRDALLRLADSYFDEGTDVSYAEGLYRYRDYQSRFPNRPESDYVMLRIGDCLRKQAGSEDRDSTNTRKALLQYQELLRAHPKTLRRDEVVARIKECRALLAGHELSVGRFYIRRGLPHSAQVRLSSLLEDYPDFDRTDESLYWLVRACIELGDLERARFFRGRLESEFPKSSWTADAPTVPAEGAATKEAPPPPG
jgi:outer membrane protein assembly factor BamD